MPSQKIPCKDCEAKTREIEEAGDRIVISCDPIPEEPGWCIIKWKYKE